MTDDKLISHLILLLLLTFFLRFLCFFPETELKRKNEILKTDIQEIVKLKNVYLDLREIHQRTQIQLNYRRKKLINELNYFYPIKQVNGISIDIL